MSQARGIVVECDWNSESSRNVQSWKLSFFNKKQMRLSRKLFSFLKSLKVANLPENATEFVRFSIRWKFGVFFSKDSWFFEKKSWRFKKCLKLEKLPYNATGIARVLEMFRVENFSFLIKNRRVCQEKSWFFLKSLKSQFCPRMRLE